VLFVMVCRKGGTTNQENSFIDNNEFGSFANMYGMQAVNRTNGLLTRSYKRSFFDYIGFFEKFVQK